MVCFSSKPIALRFLRRPFAKVPSLVSSTCLHRTWNGKEEAHVIVNDLVDNHQLYIWAFALVRSGDLGMEEPAYIWNVITLYVDSFVIGVVLALGSARTMGFGDFLIKWDFRCAMDGQCASGVSVFNVALSFRCQALQVPYWAMTDSRRAGSVSGSQTWLWGQDLNEWNGPRWFRHFVVQCTIVWFQDACRHKDHWKSTMNFEYFANKSKTNPRVLDFCSRLTKVDQLQYVFI